MDVYRRYFRVTTGPLIEAVKKHFEKRDAVGIEIAKLCREVGANPDKWYMDHGRFSGFVFDTNEPDHKIFKRVGPAWWPKRNVTEGKKLAKAASALACGDINDCLQVLGLGHRLIFSASRAYWPGLTVIPSSPMVAIVSVPWFDEDPEKLAKYEEDRKAGTVGDSSLDAILWKPTSDMIEVKEWQVQKEIDEWNTSLEERRAAISTAPRKD